MHVVSEQILQLSIIHTDGCQNPKSSFTNLIRNLYIKHCIC